MQKILFNCKKCGKDKHPFFVRDRRKDEDILSYMNELREEMAVSHSLSSPGCDSRVLDLMIPVSKEGFVGGR